MSKRIPILALAIGLGACSGEQSSSHHIGPAAPLSGAIFTTLENGTEVNQNRYGDLCDVYLNGGPRPTGPAGLPAGDYFFQVTDPSGHVLLSDDDVMFRQFSVDGSGRISSVPQNGHDTGLNLFDGGVTVQLCPLLPTPNNGCEFKVWVTRQSDFDLTANQANFGFLESASKTDNFKVCPPGVPDAGPPEVPDAAPPGAPDAAPPGAPDAAPPGAPDAAPPGAPDAAPPDEEDPNNDEQG